jgi:hypothetical protein
MSVETAPQPAAAVPNRFRLAASLVALSVPWGGAALLSWWTWSSADRFWAAYGRVVPPALRGADDRLFLQDAIAMSAVFAAVVGVVVVLARRRPGNAVGAAWVLAAVGAVLWMGWLGSVPEAKDAYLDCAATRGAQGTDVRGWSWTRFGAAVVLTGGGRAREIICR